jgi:hypothetical protein
MEIGIRYEVEVKLDMVQGPYIGSDFRVSRSCSLGENLVFQGKVEILAAGIGRLARDMAGMKTVSSCKLSKTRDCLKELMRAYCYMKEVTISFFAGGGRDH